MGTAVSVDVRSFAAPAELDNAISGVVSWLHWVDAAFSTYREDSQVQRYARGELDDATASPEFRAVRQLCRDAAELTAGLFCAAYRGVGTWDPTGLVKGWAASRASQLLADAGLVDHCVNAAGDVATRRPVRLEPWRVGIVDPRGARGEFLAVVEGHDVAVATSGLSERGTHLFDPSTGRPAVGVLQATVTGSDLAMADACATALVSAGGNAPQLARHLDDRGWPSLLVLAGGDVLASSCWRAAGLGLG